MPKSYHKTSDKFREEGSNQHAKIAWRLFKRNLLNFTIDIDEKYRRLKRRRLRAATEILNMNRNPTARSLQEKEWAKYLFENGSMIGLNERLLSQYVEWIANRRMKAIGLAPAFDIPAKNNPLPWTEHWLNSKGQQNAPQETEIESYVVGGIKQDVSAETFSGFKL